MSLRRFTCYLALCLIVSVPLAAQGGEVGPDSRRSAEEAKVDRKKATKLIRLLELPPRRIAAAPKILAMGSHAVPAIIRALDDPRPEIVGALAMIVRSLGADARSAVPKLRELAKGRDERIAFAAAWALSRFEPKGVILVSDVRGAVREIDERGKVLFTLPNSDGCLSAERLPNGNYLLGVYAHHVVREVDRKGRVVWSYSDLKSPGFAARLPGGTTMISSSKEGRVIEVDRAGKVLWTHKAGDPFRARRLMNGNTLIPFFKGKKVIEVDSKGNTVWSFSGANSASDARRLANGNTLVAGYFDKVVHEVGPNGKSVGTFAVASNTRSVLRLLDGRTIVTRNNSVSIFDAKGKRVREIALKANTFVGSVEVY